MRSNSKTPTTSSGTKSVNTNANPIITIRELPSLKKGGSIKMFKEGSLVFYLYKPNSTSDPEKIEENEALERFPELRLFILFGKVFQRPCITKNECKYYNVYVYFSDSTWRIFISADGDKMNLLGLILHSSNNESTKGRRVLDLFMSLIELLHNPSPMDYVPKTTKMLTEDYNFVEPFLQEKVVSQNSLNNKICKKFNKNIISKLTKGNTPKLLLVKNPHDKFILSKKKSC